MLTIRTQFATLIALSLLFAHSFAQTDVKSLERSLKGKQLPLRSYSADEVAHYDWQDGKLTAQVPGLRTLAIFESGSVKRHGDKIQFKGYRFTLMRKDPDDKLVGSKEVPMTLEVDLHGADPAVALPALISGLFFASVGASIAGVPAQFQNCVPWRMTLNMASDKGPVWIERKGAWEAIALADPEFQVPHTKSMPNPHYSDQAIMGGISGTVAVCLVVDETGHPTDLWIAAPARAELDEPIIESLRHSLFDPARFDGEPVSFATAVVSRLSF